MASIFSVQDQPDQQVPVTIITGDPIVAVLAEMKLDHAGVLEMAHWVEKYRPHCVPEGGFSRPLDLVPHDGMDGDRLVTDNELLAELMGRKCYDSFADAGAKRTNREYLESMWTGRVPHRSTGYHPKMTFFFAEVSRRVSHELIRNYVGSDRDEEGSPSQESTRFTHHPGIYIAHPKILDDPEEMELFRDRCQRNYDEYRETIRRRVEKFRRINGFEPKGLDKKRIYESTAGDLLMECGTSWGWTTNPMAMAKFFHERDDEAADLEMCRFARAWKRVAFARWPNLFSYIGKVRDDVSLSRAEARLIHELLAVPAADTWDTSGEDAKLNAILDKLKKALP